MKPLLAAAIIASALVSSNCFADTYLCWASATVTQRNAFTYSNGKRQVIKTVDEYSDNLYTVVVDGEQSSVYHVDFGKVYGAIKNGRINLLSYMIEDEYLFRLAGEMTTPHHKARLVNRRFNLHIKTAGKEVFYSDAIKTTARRSVNYRAKGDCYPQ